MSESALFAQFFLFGVFIVVIYDGLRIFRRIFPHGIIWISLEDGLYWTGIALMFFLQLCRENNGIIRGYIVLGVVLGAAAYYRICSRFFMKYLTKWITDLKKRLKKLCKIVTIKMKKLHSVSKQEESEKRHESE